MKNVYFLLLTFLLSSPLLAQSGKSDVQSKPVTTKEQIIISPKIFYGTIGVLFDFEESKDVVLFVKDSGANNVFETKYENIKSSSFKLNLSDLKDERYTLYVTDGKGKELLKTEIEKKK